MRQRFQEFSTTQLLLAKIKEGEMTKNIIQLQLPRTPTPAPGEVRTFSAVTQVTHSYCQVTFLKRNKDQPSASYRETGVHLALAALGIQTEVLNKSAAEHRVSPCPTDRLTILFTTHCAHYLLLLPIQNFLRVQLFIDSQTHRTSPVGRDP